MLSTPVLCPSSKETSLKASLALCTCTAAVPSSVHSDQAFSCLRPPGLLTSRLRMADVLPKPKPKPKPTPGVTAELSAGLNGIARFPTLETHPLPSHLTPSSLGLLSTSLCLPGHFLNLLCWLRGLFDRDSPASLLQLHPHLPPSSPASLLQLHLLPG